MRPISPSSLASSLGEAGAFGVEVHHAGERQGDDAVRGDDLRGLRRRETSAVETSETRARRWMAAAWVESQPSPCPLAPTSTSGSWVAGATLISTRTERISETTPISQLISSAAWILVGGVDSPWSLRTG